MVGGKCCHTWYWKENNSSRCKEEIGVLDSEINCSHQEFFAMPGNDVSSNKALKVQLWECGWILFTLRKTSWPNNVLNAKSIGMDHPKPLSSLELFSLLGTAFSVLWWTTSGKFNMVWVGGCGFQPGWFCPPPFPGDIWKCVETLLIVMTERTVPASRGQRSRYC